jgi:hypothetical protein
MDIMTIDLKNTLITVCDPLQLIPHTPVKDEQERLLGMALQGQLQTLRERERLPPNRGSHRSS